MSYKLETKLTSNQSSRAFYGASSTPTGITIHWWGSPSAGATHDGVVSWLRGRAGGTSNRGSSAHYVVSAGRVTKLAEETRATWYAGNRKDNGETIGIEMNPRMSQGGWDTLVELCADIEECQGSLKYYRHLDWKATACPGVYANQLSRLVNDVNAEHRRRKSAGSTRPASSLSSSSGSSSSSSSYRVKRTKTDNVPGAAGVLIIYLLGLFGLDVPEEVAAALVVLIGTLGTLVGGKFVSPDKTISFQQERGNFPLDHDPDAYDPGLGGKPRNQV